MMFAGWVNRQRLDVIDYLQEGNRVLKERLGGRRIRFTDAERRRLARKAYALGLRCCMAPPKPPIVQPVSMRDRVAGLFALLAEQSPGMDDGNWANRPPRGPLGGPPDREPDIGFDRRLQTTRGWY
jgi:hypothetical protein